MSQVASFYVLPDCRIGELMQALTPQKRGWLRRPKDTFWETLWQLGKDGMDYGWSGYVYVVFFEYLQEVAGVDTGKFADSPLAAGISTQRGTYALTFGPEEARGLREKLSSIDVSGLRAYWDEFTGEEFDDRDAALISAVDTLRGCLGRVSEGTTGLMLVA